MAPTTIWFLALVGIFSSVVQCAPSSLLFPKDASSLDKPVLSPPVPDLSKDLLNNLRDLLNSDSIWQPSLTNQDCKDWFQKEGFKLEDIETYNATYGDCEVPWTMCRHKSAPYGMKTTSIIWGRVPVRLRSYIRHVIALPAKINGLPEAINDNDNVVITGNARFSQILAAVGKSVDKYGFPNTTGLYHNSFEWLNAYAHDKAVPSAVAAIDQTENLAQFIILALYEKRVRGGVEEQIPGWESISHGYRQVIKNAYRDSWGDKEGVLCQKRLNDSDIISV
ncbi:hypothetical protein EJ04DRAFT_523440 [Polyplosphaeria fusca]|uniref:Uncharacterized protein n=1 Tax=Polyplosphaeria fusca TaxID=682080 RepID=A0A9P4QXT0_9PLEO|nr:hypothetical protein EJ04DRAFT_523440 [Polyplosphaeria fusca]